MMVALCVILITVGLVKCGGFDGVDVFLAEYDPKMLQPMETSLFSHYGVLGIFGYSLKRDGFSVWPASMASVMDRIAKGILKNS